MFVAEQQDTGAAHGCGYNEHSGYLHERRTDAEW